MHEYESHFYVENATFMILKLSRVNPMPGQAFREFLVLRPHQYLERPQECRTFPC